GETVVGDRQLGGQAYHGPSLLSGIDGLPQDVDLAGSLERFAVVDGPITDAASEQVELDLVDHRRDVRRPIEREDLAARAELKLDEPLRDGLAPGDHLDQLLGARRAARPVLLGQARDREADTLELLLPSQDQ